jgi:hypothetical protein
VKKRLRYGVVAGAAALSLAVFISSREPARAQGQSGKGFDAPIVFQGAGPNISSIQGLVDQFRLALGGNNNGNNAGPLNSGRREINWDGGGSNATSPGPTPFTVFLASRGANIVTPGSGFVQAPPSGLATTFGNASYANVFKTFSPLRLFSPIGSNVTEVQFFIPGTGTVPAVVSGFGAVFSDVDQPDGSGPGNKRGNRGASTLIQYFGANGQLLYSSFVPASPGDGNLTFFAVLFDDARIASVRILTGDSEPGPDDGDLDIVMMDDFIYGEPRGRN